MRRGPAHTSGKDGSSRRRAPNCPGRVLDGLIVAMLSAAPVPLSAYDVVAGLREHGRVLVPTTIYRSLARLCATGKVQKVETLSAFRINDAPGALLMVCEQCGQAQPLAISSEQDRLSHAMVNAGFKARKISVEAAGICQTCSEGKEPGG